MPEQTQAKQASLADEVDALLGAMQQTCDRLESQLAETPAEPEVSLDGPVTDDGAAAVEELSEQVDAMVREVAAVVPTDADPNAEALASSVSSETTAEPEATVAEDQPHAETMPGLETAAEPESPLAEVSSEIAPDADAAEPAAELALAAATIEATHSVTDKEQAEPAGELTAQSSDTANEPFEESPKDSVSAPPAETIETPESEEPTSPGESEDELASLTDELLGGESEPKSATPPPAPVAAAASIPAAAAAVAMASTATNAPAPSVQPVAPAGAAAVTTAAPTEALGVRLRRRLTTVGASLRHVVEPAALRIAAKVSAPILAQPKNVRDTLGWFAAYSLFVGATVAGWAFLVHTPAAPAPADPGVRLADDHSPEGAGGHVVRRGLPVAADAHGAADAHAAKGDDHGDAHGKAEDSKKQAASKGTSKKSDTKKSDAKKAPAKKADSGHGGH